jgi:hypothetical protein
MTKKILHIGPHPAFGRDVQPAERVYISGAVTGKPRQKTKRKFGQAERYIKALGYCPVNPLKNGLPKSATWEQHMEIDFALLAMSERVLMLPDWEDSRGARRELKEAVRLGKKITFL